MRRTDSYRNNSSRNSSMFNNTSRVTPNHLMDPSMFVDHMWFHDDDVTPGVKITEIRSSDSDKTANDDKDYNRNDWKTYGNDKEQSYKNTGTRITRSLESQVSTNDQSYDYSIEDNEFGEDRLYTDLFGSTNNEKQNENVCYNQQVNCFTILEKHKMADSDTSGDEYANVELLGYDEPDWSCNSKPYDSDLVTFTPETEMEKRTVWIYSFKNKRLLSENDFELVNIPSQDSIVSSLEDFDQELEDSEDNRAPTPLPRPNRRALPIPPLNVPRINLALNPTLPTVTEVTESDKQSSSNQTDLSHKFSREKIGFKENNWFSSEHATPKEKYDKTDVTNSILNWMALSPREKRRRFRNKTPNIESPKEKCEHLPTLTERSVCGDTIEETLKHEDKCVEKSTADKGLQTSYHSQKSVLERISSVADSARKSVRTLRSNFSSARGPDGEPKIETSDSNVEACTPKDRGDHIRAKKVPRIKISPKSTAKEISDPLEKLDGDDWIKEDKIIKDTVEPDDRASDALWIRNMPLLKPAEWTEYLPITESIPSLHFTINTDSEVDVAWYTRVARFFRCCK